MANTKWEATVAAESVEAAASKKSRSRRLLALGEQKRLDFHRRFLGRQLQILVEDRTDKATGLRVGMSDNYVKVLFEDDDVAANEMASVVIRAAREQLVLGALHHPEAVALQATACHGGEVDHRIDGVVVELAQILEVAEVTANPGQIQLRVPAAHTEDLVLCRHGLCQGSTDKAAGSGDQYCAHRYLLTLRRAS